MQRLFPAGFAAGRALLAPFHQTSGAGHGRAAPLRARGASCCLPDTETID
jgi:hypothetical protein